ncbi:GHMP kinase [Schizophyllum amplum]|uniref:Galactokinase n=1 Tax=Schizophyllum amplum TaxID=97359 RepID=A0A550CI94_9AGAR|nr:GHMP kinase [Auriculariopsis ampla]
MAALAPIPIYTNLTDLYDSLGTAASHAERWNNLIEEFEKRYGGKPKYIARAPGRVNLIGEHIDYALFGVQPMAVEADILIACAPSKATSEPTQPGHVVAQNLAKKYGPQVFTPLSSPSKEAAEDPVRVWQLDIDKKELRWESYVKAGYYGVLNEYFASSSTTPPIPVDLLVTGSVPAGSGLSSSAAMVVASTLAFLSINGKLDEPETLRLSKGALVGMAMQNEQRVGVNSGGMDQAASVISTPSAALYITFYPKLAAEPTPLPAGAVFVIANSLVVSDKAVTAKFNYNLRVVETLAAARVLARVLGLNVGPKEKITLREVVGRLVQEDKEKPMTDEEMRDVLVRMAKEVEVLRPKNAPEGELGVTLEEMIEMTGLSKEEFNDVYLSWVEVEATRFQLYKRAKHVFSEALRVLQFRDTCLQSPADVFGALGALMNESQKSCAEDYGCSCPELDTLTSIARGAGAWGSRLTGAGWGGCSVSLVSEDKVESFIKEVTAQYEPYKTLSEEQLKDAIFATKPSSGACVFKFEE